MTPIRKSLTLLPLFALSVLLPLQVSAAPASDSAPISAPLFDKTQKPQHNAATHHPAHREATRQITRGWSVSPGEDLHDVLRSWGAASGWTIVWQSDFTYQIAGRASFSGSVVDAVGSLITGMQEARPAPVAEIYRENRVIVIKDGLTATR